MTDQTPQLDLDEIEARANAATKGPWGFYDGDNYADVAADLQMTSRSSYTYREKVARLEDEDYWDDPAHENDDESRASEQMAANARFIAAAREDVPALVAEVRRLRATVDRVRQLHDGLDVETALTSPDELITRGRAARKIAAALDGWTAPAPTAR
ncbi:hypothetical protein [Streptomyces sp. NPDC091299]|uniref:hypothetical protein n=1 Tax=Streptomyces sp. NPDC091299 TaxID=3155302 RepID=UPI0034395602